MFLGIPLYMFGVEDLLANNAIFNSTETAISSYSTIGAISITAAHGYSMVMNGNARKVYSVQAPQYSFYSIFYLGWMLFIIKIMYCALHSLCG